MCHPLKPPLPHAAPCLPLWRLRSKKEGFPSAWLPVKVLSLNAHSEMVTVEYVEIKETDDDDSPQLREELKAERCVTHTAAAAATRRAACVVALRP